MTKPEKYYFISVELSNGKTIYKHDVKAMNEVDAWERAYDEEDTKTLSLVDDIGNYYILTKSHIVQVVVQKIDTIEDVNEQLDKLNEISF